MPSRAPLAKLGAGYACSAARLAGLPDFDFFLTGPALFILGRAGIPGMAGIPGGIPGGIMFSDMLSIMPGSGCVYQQRQ